MFEQDLENAYNQYEDKVTSAYNQYENKIYEIADQVFNMHIKPYLYQHGIKLIAGNGTFYIAKIVGGGKYRSLDSDDIDPEICMMLNKSVPGFNQRLGSLMPDYNPDKEIGE